VPRIGLEVAVGREDGCGEPFGYRAQEYVDRGALDTAAPARIEHVGRPDVVGRLQRFIGKRRELVSQTVEHSRFRNAGQNFLADNADKKGAALGD
jgi:hypothetical protein